MFCVNSAEDFQSFIQFFKIFPKNRVCSEDDFQSSMSVLGKIFRA